MPPKRTVVLGDMQTARRLVGDSIDSRVEDVSGFTHGTSHGAPEVLIYHKASKRSDVYSLGLTIWEILAGRKLPFSYSTEYFEGRDEDVIRREHEENLSMMKKLLPNRFSVLWDFIEKACKYDQDERYRDANVMLRTWNEEFKLFQNADPSERANNYLMELINRDSEAAKYLSLKPHPPPKDDPSQK